MPLLHQCAREGCEILTMGTFCALHDENDRLEQADHGELTDALTAAASAAAADDAGE